jgi:hypothetical protein
MARYPGNLIGVSRLVSSALRWPYGIRKRRIRAASTCDVYLRARRARPGRHAANNVFPADAAALCLYV